MQYPSDAGRSRTEILQGPHAQASQVMTPEKTPGFQNICEPSSVSIGSGSGEGVIYWQLVPPVDTESHCEAQVQGLRNGLQMSFCNDDLASILGVKSTEALLAKNGIDTLKAIGVEGKLQEMVESNYQLEEFLVVHGNASGRERSYRVNTHCIIQDGLLIGVWNSLRDDTERLQHARELEMSQKLLSDSQTMAGVGTWCSDFHGNFEFQSPQVAKHFGLPPDREYPFFETIERVHLADRERLLATREAAMRSDEVQRVEFRVLDDDGAVRYLLATSRSTFDEQGQPQRWMGSVQDISRYKLQSEARESQYLYLPDPLFSIKLDVLMDTNMEPGAQIKHVYEHARLVDCNHALAKVLGREREDILGARPGFLASFWEEFGLKFCREGYHLEKQRFSVSAPDGDSTLWFEVNLTGVVEHDALARIWVHCRDITEQVQMRMSLEDVVKARTEALQKEIQIRRRNNEKLRKQAVLVTHMSEAVIVTNPDRCIGEWNNGAEGMFGFSRDEANGRQLDELLGLGPDSMGMGGDEESWMETMDGWRGELTCICKDGAEMICESSVTLLDDDEGQPLSLIHVIRDVGERKRQEEELATSKAAAVRANLAKTRFIRGLSHEMRTPLNAILGFEQLLERLPEQPLSQRQLNYLRQIRSGGEHLLELVNEVLDLARIEAGEIGMEPEVLDLGKLIDECLQLLRPQAEEREVSISGNYHDGGQIIADPKRLKQILFNLMSNGVKYNSRPGTLDVSVTVTADHRVRISVSDSGPGIPEESLESLYEPFNRLDVADIDTNGTGLGLTITRELVTAMQGEMGVNSVPGKGSEFWIVLDRMPDSGN